MGRTGPRRMVRKQHNWEFGSPESPEPVPLPHAEAAELEERGQGPFGPNTTRPPGALSPSNPPQLSHGGPLMKPPQRFSRWAWLGNR